MRESCMDRRDVILKYITKEKQGIEIGPFHSPLTPKRDGYNCLVMDVFDLATLKKMARENVGISDEQCELLEDVDLLGSSTHIDKVVEQHGKLGQFDYLVSSHNFEHLPNPIRFLQGCAKVLKPGGMLSMAIPDRRACYDYFRSATPLSAWLEAYFADRNQPTLTQNFDEKWVRASYDHHGVPYGSFFRGAPPTAVTPAMTFERHFKEWEANAASNDREYEDAHCSVFTPSSFELLIRDCAYLGLINFEIVEMSDSPGVDFFAHLRVATDPAALRPADYETLRNELLHRILDEAAETSTQGANARQKAAQPNVPPPQVEPAPVAAQAPLPPLPSALDSTLEQLRDIAARSAQRLEDINQALAQQLGDQHGQAAALAAAHEERQRLSDERQRLNDDVHRLNATVLAMRMSTSWKITAPLRRMMNAVRGMA
ncbi:methyltransferase domain-containing protein [Alcaligenaceae bacterium C4P045]|nr:methyltransferase domain-containing protein [Alcaligenaceae bacterium C4P045]